MSDVFGDKSDVHWAVFVFHIFFYDENEFLSSISHSVYSVIILN